MKEGQPCVRKVWCAVDCGVVVNPDAARNMTEGAITGKRFYAQPFSASIVE